MKIKQDKRNYRKHGDRNKAMIRRSLEECGAGRSILIDNENTAVAGNGVLEQAEKLGIPIRVIESDGSELIAVKRTDLSPDDPKLRGECERYLKKIDLSIFDIVDLDAYGSPSKQLQILFDRKYCGVVCVTAIMANLNKGDKKLLIESGIPHEIIEKIPISMMPMKYFDMMKHFLAKNGVKRVSGSFFQDLGMQKSYCWFKTEKVE